jgi:hypothetical protein
MGWERKNRASFHFTGMAITERPGKINFMIMTINTLSKGLPQES